MPVKPAHELVGEMLMDLRRPKEAIPAFEALGLAPSGRSWDSTTKLVVDPAFTRWNRVDLWLRQLRALETLA